MGVLDRASRTDQWPELERAGRMRFFDALALATGLEPRPTGAVYLVGYAAEILLKTAYYRVRGLGQFDDVAPELRGMRDRARELGYAWHSGRYRHNLLDLAGLLTHERQARGMPLDPYLAATLTGHVIVVAEHWSEQLRYKDVIASEAELAELFDSVSWIVDNYGALGS